MQKKNTKRKMEELLSLIDLMKCIYLLGDVYRTCFGEKLRIAFQVGVVAGIFLDGVDVNKFLSCYHLGKSKRK